MPRKPATTFSYYKSRKGYYIYRAGKQILLASGPDDRPDGPTYRAAVLRFSQFVQATQLEREGDSCSVNAVIARYYYHLEREGRTGTLHLAETMLDPAVADFGEVQVRELKPFVVKDWLDRQTTWGNTTKNTAIAVLSRAFNWARKQGFITANPIAEMEKPEARSRGKEVLIPDALAGVLVAAANPAFAKVLRFLRGTGCRPGEVAHARASHYRADIRALVFPWGGDDVGWRWKNAARAKRDRVIFLPPDLQALVEGEIAKRPKDYLFRTIRRRLFSNTTLTNRFLALREHEDVVAWCEANDFAADNLILYGFRHTYATNMLARGVPIKILADWMGTSVRQLEQTYSHVHEDLHAMREVFVRLSAGASAQPAP